MTPQGMRKEHKSVLTPVRAFTVAAPPNNSIEVTITFAKRQKKMKVICAALPQRAKTISQTVWAVLARLFTSMARMPKSKTWMVAPLAYQKGPDTPYCHATFEDCKRVAAQVHCETMTEAVSPVLTDLPAVLKNSDVCTVPFAYLSKYTMTVVKIEKKAPNPRTIAKPEDSGKGVLSPKKLFAPMYEFRIDGAEAVICFA
jgi:hypothetical protein